MIENPRLMERPIIVNGDKAVVARPAEKVEEVL
jgi:arsenate reductase